MVAWHAKQIAIADPVDRVADAEVFEPSNSIGALTEERCDRSQLGG
jgi:hypothetical protein